MRSASAQREICSREAHSAKLTASESPPAHVAHTAPSDRLECKPSKGASMKVIRFAALIVLSVVSTLSIADEHRRPAFISGEIIKHTYDGVTDDLLTGGLGASGLQGAAPGFVD